MDSNLPIHLTSFVGRERELNEVDRLISEGRLVTLVGPGGCGKTRLAVEVVRPLAIGHRDGAWFVNLAPVSDPELLPTTVAGALGLPATVALDGERLAGHLAGHQAILLLDNAEHLVDAVAALAEKLALNCPELRLLVTTREPLGVDGEWVYRVGSLPEPDAVKLFADRAARADAEFTLSAANLGSVGEICRRLDGIPLAIELAAACVGSMSLEGIQRRLDERFRLLVGGRRTAVGRHRTLRAALEWSEALLTEPERRLFHRLSVFAGDFDMDGAEAVGAGGDVRVADVLPLLRRLVERSLVQLLRDDPHERYRLLESLREFAREGLVASGEAGAAGLAHARHYTAVAHSLFDASAWVQEMRDSLTEQLLPDFRAALVAAADTDPEWLAELAAALFPLLCSPGVQDGRHWLEAGLAGARAGSEEELRLLTGLSIIARSTGDFAMALARARQALVNRQKAGDERGRIRTLLLIAAAVAVGGDHGGSVPLAREAVEAARQLGDPQLLDRSLNSLAMSLIGAGEGADAERFAEEAAELTRRQGFHSRLAVRLDTLATAQLKNGRPQLALATQREAIRCVSGEDLETILPPLATMAAILIGSSQARRALRLAGAIDRHGESVGLDIHAIWDVNLPWLDRGLDALGAQAAAVRAAGRRLSLKDAIAEALREEADDQPGREARLSRRELEVARLVREGLSNRAIAERLFISERTAEGHVASLLNKLGMDSRAQVAAWVAENLPRS